MLPAMLHSSSAPSQVSRTWQRPVYHRLPLTCSLYFCFIAVSLLPADCSSLSTNTSGVYWFNVGGSAVEAYCDMETDGGGWMLVLNYLHQANTNPDLQLRDTERGFPMPTSANLSADESSSFGKGGSWGHMDLATISQVRSACIGPPLQGPFIGCS